MSGFQSVYKRHTPFSIVSSDYVGNHIIIDKSGDVLLYAYLFTDKTFFDWSSLESVEMYIGGEKICTWDSKYITTFYPFLSSTTFSKSAYDDTLTFLPIPVPMLPLKNMRYHQCEFKILWKQTPQNIRFITVSAFLDEDIPDCDILIQQVKKMSVIDGETIRINGLVKYMVSDSLTQPKTITYDGQDVNVAPIEVYRYFHTKHGDVRERYFNFVDVDLGMPRTCQRINDKMFIFSSLNPYVYIYNTNTYYGSVNNYVPIYTGFTGVVSSCTDGTTVYASSTEGDLFSVGLDGTFTNLDIKADHGVYSMHYYNHKIYMVGIFDYSVYDGTGLTQVGLYEQHNGSFIDGNRLIIFRFDGITVINLDNGARTNLNSLNIADYGSQLFNLYDQFSSSIIVDGVIYIASGYNNIFQAGNEQYTLPTQEQEYMTLVYDGRNAIFVFGRKSIFRYSIVKYNLFIPFCTDVNDFESTGCLNFNMIREVKLNGCGNGTLYTVNYNFLRVQNGMTGLLYAQ